MSELKYTYGGGNYIFCNGVSMTIEEAVEELNRRAPEAGQSETISLADYGKGSGVVSFKEAVVQPEPAEGQEPVASLRCVNYEGIAKNGSEMEAVIDEKFLHRFDLDGTQLYAQPQRPMVPDKLIYSEDGVPFIDDANARSIYVDGWNDCRKAMLTAAPAPGSGHCAYPSAVNSLPEEEQPNGQG